MSEKLHSDVDYENKIDNKSDGLTICVSCGASLREGINFCTNCGEKLSDKTTETITVLDKAVATKVFSDITEKQLYELLRSKQVKAVEKLDLETLQNNTLFYLQGDHNRARYLCRKEQNTLLIWLDLDGSGIRRDFSRNRISFLRHEDAITGKTSFENMPGLEIGVDFTMPYFRYNNDAQGRKVVETPDDSWIETLKKIVILK